MKLSVVVPVYNEMKTIREILKRVRDVDIEKEIIMIDDYSTDGTREILEELKEADGRVFYHEKNKGKGAALRTGFAHAIGEYVIVQDADLEYDPQDYHKLLAATREKNTPVVYGSRFLGRRRPDSMAFSNWMANRSLTAMTNLLYGSKISDMETCYKLFQSDIIKDISFESDRFGFEPEITAKILRRGITIHEVPIAYRGRDEHEGKKIGYGDGVSAIWTIIKYRFKD